MPDRNIESRQGKSRSELRGDVSRGLLARETERQTTSADIAMTAMRPLKITVNETEETAWVDAGIKVADVLDFLGNYVTKDAPRGWTLPAPPFFVLQSIGGAVATGTHGSSLKHKSMSSQVLALRVVLANGTLAEITAASHPFLMKVITRKHLTKHAQC